VGGQECDVAITRTRALGFDGKIWAVHPKRDRLGGIACVRSVNQIDGAPDAAFVAVRREPAIDVVRTLAAQGCGGAVIYASGFAETGAAHLERALLEAASGMPLMGPNCYGFVNGLAKAALWPDEHGIEPLASGIAIITQSGNMACNFTMSRRALPVAGVFAIGNQADLDMARMLDAFLEDDRITAVGLHIEGLKEVAAFARAAQRARQLRKPVVVLKTGRSEQGAKVALSHTASLAGADALYDALFERFGVARMASVTAFLETLKFLHYGGPLKDNRVVSMSCSGGEAALVADMAAEKNVRFPPFDQCTKPKVAESLNEYVSIENPLDYHTFIWNDEARLTSAFSAVLSGGFDVGMLILDIPTNPQMSPATWLVTLAAYVKAACRTNARAAMVASLPECMPLDAADKLARNGIAPMLGLDDALTAFAAAAEIGRNWAQRAEPPALLPSQPNGGKARPLSEFEAKQLLKQYGLAVPDGFVCNVSEAPEAADRFGYPVTLKVSSAEIAHKSEAGGVALNLTNLAEVTAAAAKLSKLSDEILIERMVTGTVAELILGLKSDPQFGLALVIGAGGVLTELLKDTVTLLLPTSREEIERALPRLKAWKLVEGFRGRSGDRAAVVRAIEALASFAEANRGRIEEVDVNPLVVLPTGQGAVAVDALIRMKTER
jgi:acetate---CoA ligase (ADP-forming)